MTSSSSDLQKRLESLDETLSERPNDAIRLRDLVSRSDIRVLEVQDPAEIDQRIQNAQKALQKTPDHHSERATRFEELAFAYKRRHETEEELSDIKLRIRILAGSHGIEYGMTEVMKNFEDFHLAVRGELDNIEDLPDIDQAIELYHQALDITSKDHPDRFQRLSDLAIAFGIKSKGDAIDQAISLYHEALDISPSNHPDQGLRLQQLAYMYKSRCSDFYSTKDYENCITLFGQALDMTPKNQPSYATLLDNLASVYDIGFENSKAKESLDESIRLRQQALEGTDIPDRPLIVGSLATSFYKRYEGTLKKTDLNESIRLHQEATNLMPEHYVDKAEDLEELASLYDLRFQTQGDLDDLDQAIQLRQQALTITPEDFIHRHDQFRELAYLFKERFRIKRHIIYLNESVGLYQNALDLLPDDHQNRRSYLEDLARTYQERFHERGVEGDFESSLYYFRESLENEGSLDAGVELLKTCAKASRWSEAYEAASRTIQLLSVHAPRFLGASSRQDRLAKFGGLASDAAAIALMADMPSYEACRLLDLGRGIIIGSLNDLRSDISDLEETYPGLAKRFIKSRERLDAPEALDVASGHYFADLSLDMIIDEIRELPGFERFLMGPSEDEMKLAACNGPVIYINVSGYRCDALTITKDKISAVSLPRLKKGEIKYRALTLESSDIHLLEWLWETVAKPILESMGLHDKPTGRWPHIWWIPTSVMTKFPIHAAGYHFRNSETVIDRVISSYTFSIRALARSRRRQSVGKATHRPLEAVVVGMEKTPGQKTLDFVKPEINKLKDACSIVRVRVTTPLPEQKNVLTALKKCDIFHFAGHGSADQLRPSKSSLLLRDRSLTIDDLLEINLHSRMPLLAYLSACNTGQVKHNEFLDEGLHLIAAYQAVGFRHVIGTLWNVDDELCVRAAALTYERINSLNFTDESVSEGLHHAVLKLRDTWVSENTGTSTELSMVVRGKDASKSSDQVVQGELAARGERDVDDCEDTPLSWVPYVHFGI